VIRHVSLKSKSLAVMAVPMLVLIVGSTLGYLTRVKSNEALHDVRKTYEIVQAVEGVQISMSDAEAGMRGYLLTGQDDFLQPYDRGVSALPSAFRRLADLEKGDSIQENRVLSLETLSVDELTLLARLKPYAPILTVSARRTVTSLLREGNNISANSRNLLAAMQGQAQTLLAGREQHLATVRLLAFRIQLIALPIGALSGLILVLFFVTGLVRRIRLVEHSARMLEQGMPMPTAPAGKDEISRLGRAIVETGTRLMELQTELRHMATIDPQTRLLNRRGFMALADHQLEVARRQVRPLALLFVDLDGLKHVNDTIGHHAGDSMIAEAAHVLKATFRSADLTARVGGDEFCILLTTDPVPDVQSAIDRLMAEVADRNAEPGRPYRLSFSFGVGEFDPAFPSSLDELMQTADNRMYEQKRAKLRH
jgi:diguanylate cyclase (GGDEF)-like protein